MKRKTITAAILLSLCLIITQAMPTVSAVKIDLTDKDVAYLGDPYLEYIEDSYDVKDSGPRPNYYTDIVCDGAPAWRQHLSDDGKEVALEYLNGVVKAFEKSRMKIPDRFISERYGTHDVTSILGSCNFRSFDLNPKNKYMKLVDNVVFSKDGKILMSYAQGDERTVYEIPYGTEIIGKNAFDDCSNIAEISIPDSVIELQSGAFASMNITNITIPYKVEEIPNGCFFACDNLQSVYIPENSKLKRICDGAFQHTAVNELILPSFDIEISNVAFRYNSENVKLKSYVKPDVKTSYSSSTGTYKLKWDKVSNVSEYEVYQKLSDGSYKLLKTTTKTSIKFNGIKSGKKYTFAIKPIAKIKAVEDRESSKYVSYPEYYTIEGTMSDDVTFKAK